MDQVFVIRHKVMSEGRSVRAVARELGVSRNTVRRYLAGAPVGERKRVGRSQPVMDRVRPRAEAVLAESPCWTTNKQRLTATRLHRMLRDEGLEVGETTVKRIVREWRRRQHEVFVPLVYRPGDLAQVDFFEVVVDVAAERRKAALFVMRLMYSGRDFAWLYPRQDGVCFYDGHVRAFEHFDAVPHREALDNLRPAVARVLVGSERELAPRFEALAAHYVFEPCFARPRTGHDKGGVEARGRAIRLQELVPIPSGPSLEAISRELLARLDARCSGGRDAQGRTIGERFADERERMLPLPAHTFVAAQFRPVCASRRSLVRIDGAYYSVWSRWNELDLSAYLGVDHIEIVGPDDRVVHPRQRFGGRSVDYRHYLPELSRKPQALRQVADELVSSLGEPFATLWRQLVEERGPKQAARVFAQVLRNIVDRGAIEVSELVTAALARGEPVLLALRPHTVVSATAEVPAALAGVEVLCARASEYDTLLAAGGDA